MGINSNKQKYDILVKTKISWEEETLKFWNVATFDLFIRMSLSRYKLQPLWTWEFDKKRIKNVHQSLGKKNTLFGCTNSHKTRVYKQKPHLFLKLFFKVKVWTQIKLDMQWHIYLSHNKMLAITNMVQIS